MKVRYGDEIERLAEALWAWSWTVDQGRNSKPYPYERLIPETKNELRAYARGIYESTIAEMHGALDDIAKIQADGDQAKWMRDRAKSALNATGILVL